MRNRDTRMTLKVRIGRDYEGRRMRNKMEVARIPEHRSSCGWE